MLSAAEAFSMDISVSPKPAAPASVKSMKLASGIRIIARDNGSGTANLKFAVMCGSSAESLSEQGSSKLLSVAAFGGSTERSGLRMCRDLENAGATFSASSDREKIVYSVSCLADKVDEVVAVVAEAITKPIGENKFYTLEETAKDTEKIIMNARSSDPQAQVEDLLLEAAYGENTAMGKPEYAPNLKHLVAGEVMDFRNAHFKTGNLVISGSGVSHDTLKSLVECYFHGMPEGKPTTTAAAYSGGDMKVRTDLDGETYMAIGFPAPASAAATLLTAKLEDKIADLGMKKGKLSAFSRNGMVGFTAHGDPAAASKAIEAAVGALKAVGANAGVSDGDKASITLSNFLALEGEDSAGALLEAAIAGVDPSTHADVRKVSSADVSACAKAALAGVPAFAVYGATAGTPSFSTVTKMCK